MDEELVQILRISKLEELKETFLTHKVLSVKALKMVTDSQFSAMGVAVGHVATLRSMISEGTSDDSVVEKSKKIKEIVEQIRNRGNQTKDARATKKSISTKEKVQKEKKINIGWLHRSSASKKFRQIRKTGGGTIRHVTCTDDSKITVDFLKSEGERMFFPRAETKYGPLTGMTVELGNFNQEIITKFTDTGGSDCSFAEYLRSHGLYASRSYFYLLTTLAHEQEDEEHEANVTEGTLQPLGSKACNFPLPVPSDELMEPLESTEDTTPHFIVGNAGKEIEDVNIDEHSLLIEYSHSSESSYCEVMVITTSFFLQVLYLITMKM